MSEDPRLVAAWFRPLLFCAAAAGLVAILVVLATAANAIPLGAGVAVQCGAASASLTFTIGQIGIGRRVTVYEVSALAGGTVILFIALLAVRPS